LAVSPPRTERPRDRAERGARARALAWWNLAWIIAIAMASLAIAAFLGLSEKAAYALAAGAAPALAGFALLAGDHRSEPVRWTATLGLWAAGSAAAAIMAGGIDGPLALWLLTPVAVAGVLGGAEMLARAGAFAFAAAAVCASLELLGMTPQSPASDLAVALGMVCVLTTTVGLGAGLVLARRREQASIRVLEARLAHLVALLDDQANLVLQVEFDGGVSSIYGRPPAGLDIAGLPDGIIGWAREEDRDAVAEAIRRAGVARSAEVEISAPGDPGRRLALHFRSPGKDRLVATMRDMSAEQARMELLQTAKADAESLAAGKSRFLASMSHELRTPLNAIMGFSDIMRNRLFGDLPGRYAEYAELIHESGAHLLDLINDVLDMSKIEAHRYELVIETFDARDPVSGALRLMRVQADAAGVALRASLPPQAVEIDADERALKQIVLNLLSNAIKFTPEGGSVTLGVADRNEVLEIIVADTGVGIAPEDVERLGRPYEQVGDASRKAMGTGLGLSLVRSFAELHGGDMTIESTLGVGTAVTVRIPVVHRQQKLNLGDNVVAFTPQR